MSKEKLQHNIRRVEDDFNGGFKYQMPCTIVSIDTEKIYVNESENESEYIKASVQFITAKNEEKTATAISYNVKEEQLDAMEQAYENQTPLLLESRFDQDSNDGQGAWFLKLSHLVFGAQLDDDDFLFEAEPAIDETTNESEEEEEEEEVIVPKKKVVTTKAKARKRVKVQA